MRPHGVQGHRQFAGDVRAVQVGSEQPEHVELAFAQRLNQILLDGRAVVRLAGGCQQSTGIAPGDPMLRGRFQQLRQAGAFVDEDADVALRLGQRQGALQRHERSGDVAAHLVGERLKYQDFDRAACPVPSFRCVQEALQEPHGRTRGAVPPVTSGLRQENPGQRDVLEFAQVAEAVLSR